MHVKTRNVETAFSTFVRGIHTGIFPVDWYESRNGPAIRIPEPVTITYKHPRERVLFNPARDANPFFHLYESLWMLAGREDVAPLKYYVGRMAEFSDDGETFNGAYGKRWRDMEIVGPSPGWRHGVNQLSVLVEHLGKNPNSRRAVLSMWNVEQDLLKVDSSKDVCCNTHVYFSIRELETINRVLDMTVCNRSNDLVWGAFGANAVHFSFLQEYMANSLGIKVGHYHQITNDLHCYLSNWKPDEYLKVYEPVGPITPVENLDWYEDGYRQYRSLPLVEDRATFDREVKGFVEVNYCRDGPAMWTENIVYQEPFLERVAKPMCAAFHRYRAEDLEGALETIKSVEAEDWREAGRAWLQRRIERRQARGVSPG